MSDKSFTPISVKQVFHSDDKIILIDAWGRVWKEKWDYENDCVGWEFVAQLPNHLTAPKVQAPQDMEF